MDRNETEFRKACIYHVRNGPAFPSFAIESRQKSKSTDMTEICDIQAASVDSDDKK